MNATSDGRHPDPLAARERYREHAAEAGRLLRAVDDATRRLAAAEEERTTAYAAVEEEWARLDGMEERAEGIWRELTTRFGPQAAGPLPEPDAGRVSQAGAEQLLREAHELVRKPVEHPLRARYARMAMLGFAVALVLAVLGAEVAHALHDVGKSRFLALFGPVLAGPYVGFLAATGWIRLRTSHEEKEYAVDTAIAGAFGGAGVWVIALAFVVIRLVT